MRQNSGSRKLLLYPKEIRLDSMQLFGKKRDDDEKIFGQSGIPDGMGQHVHATSESPVLPRMSNDYQPQHINEEKPMAAPLFIKIDRYRSILDSIGQIRGQLTVMRNSLATLSKIEETRHEAMELIQKTLENMEEKTGILDNDLVKPQGFRDATSIKISGKATEIENSVANLRTEIAKLRKELDVSSNGQKPSNRW